MKDTDTIPTVPLVAHEAMLWRYKRIRNYLIAGWATSALALMGVIAWVIL